MDELEIRYAAFDGLNLSFETREGILKHCSRANAEALCAIEPDGPARRFLASTQPSLEAQLVNVADEIAYNAHDIDDGYRSGLLTLEQLGEVPLFARLRDEALAEHAGLAGKRLLFETLRRLLSQLVNDLVAHTRGNVERRAPASAHALRALPPLAALSPALKAENAELKRFLFGALYRHPRVTASTALGREVVAELFAAYRDRPAELPADYGATADRPRAIADYIAGMTDRFALREHARLTGRRVFDAA